MAESVKVTAPHLGRTVQVRSLAPSTIGGTGKSAYQIWLDEGHTGTIEDYVADMAAIHLRGEVPTVDDLPGDGVVEGDAYVVEADGHLWIFAVLRDEDGVTLVDGDGRPLGEWVDLGEWTGGGGSIDPTIVGGDIGDLADPTDIIGGLVTDLP